MGEATEVEEEATEAEEEATTEASALPTQSPKPSLTPNPTDHHTAVMEEADLAVMEALAALEVVEAMVEDSGMAVDSVPMVDSDVVEDITDKLGIHFPASQDLTCNTHRKLRRIVDMRL